MADPDKHLPTGLPEDEDARAAAIDERIERLKRLHGWASDTRMVSAEDVKAVVVAVDGKVEQPKPEPPTLVLRYTLGGRDHVVEISDDHHDIGAGEKSKLRILDASVAARHCRISRDGDGFRVRDMNTHTGTWVNDERIPLSAAFVDGDTLRCGDVAFGVSIGATGQAAKAAAVPPPAPVAEATIARAATIPPEDEPEVVPAGQAAPAAREAITGAAAACFVVYFDAGGQEGEVEVPHDRPLVVGRRSTADLRLMDHGISSMHAAFEWVDGEVVVRDLGSTNGTWVRGERVPRAVLEDQEVVRLGLVPLRVCFVAEAEAAPAEEPAADFDPPAADEIGEEIAEGLPEDVAEASDASEPEPDAETEAAPAEAPLEEGPASWHLVFVTDRGAVLSITLDKDQSCVVAGDGPAEISVQGRGLKPEHLQFDWTDAGLEVMQTRRDATFKVNGKSVTQAALQGGDVVTAGSLVVRVVRAPLVAAPEGASRQVERWAKHLQGPDSGLELLFVDPEAAGGRAELTIWGDGAAQLQQHSGASSDRYPATLEPEFLGVLLNALVQAGFPDASRRGHAHPGAGPELNASRGDERAQVALGDGLTSAAPRWNEVRELLRAIISHVLG